MVERIYRGDVFTICVSTSESGEVIGISARFRDNSVDIRFDEQRVSIQYGDVGISVSNIGGIISAPSLDEIESRISRYGVDRIGYRIVDIAENLLMFAQDRMLRSRHNIRFKI